MAYLKGVCHASFSTIRKFLRNVVGMRVSRGPLAKLIQKVSAALGDAYQALWDARPVQRLLNVDETGPKDNGKLWWTWCFRAELHTLFKIEPSRGSEVLLQVLGEEFHGVLGCDDYAAYRKYMADCSIAVQFCLAHRIREVKFLLTLPEEETRNYAERLLDQLRPLFGAIHHREEMTPEQFQRALERSRKAVLKMGLGSGDVYGRRGGAHRRSAGLVGGPRRRHVEAGARMGSRTRSRRFIALRSQRSPGPV